MIRLLCMVLISTSWMSPTLAVDSRISLSIYPSISYAPATIEVRLSIDPDASNRGFNLRIDGEDYGITTERDLAGASAPKRWTFRYPDLPHGEYEAVLVVWAIGGKVVERVERTFIVE